MITYIFKIVVVGSTCSGKTDIVQAYTAKRLPKNPVPTIGVEFAINSVRSGVNIKLQVWDTAGQERYRTIISAHYRRALGALVVYDVTERISFSNLSHYIDELRNYADPGVEIVIVGNKRDEVLEDPSQRAISIEEARQFAESKGCRWVEISSRNVTQVNDVFACLASRIYEKSCVSQAVEEAEKSTDKPNCRPNSNANMTIDVTTSVGIPNSRTREHAEPLLWGNPKLPPLIG